MSNNLGAVQLAPNQTQKEQAINDAVGRMDAALTEVLTLNVDSTDTVTLTDTQFASHVLFRLEDDGADGAVTLNVGTLDRGLFIVENNTGQAATVRVSGQVPTPPVIPTGERHVLYANETAVYPVAAAIAEAPVDGSIYVRRNGAWEVFTPEPQNYDFGFVFGDTPIADQILGRVRIGRDIETGIDFAGSFGGVGTNPTATFDIDVQVAGVSVGTISISTGGVVTFDASTLPVVINAGEEVTFIAPNTPDATVANGSFVLTAMVD